MSPKPTTVLTAEEWSDRVIDAAGTAEELLRFLRDKRVKPGVTVLACLLAARGVCESVPDLPDFAWYVARVKELSLSEPQ